MKLTDIDLSSLAEVAAAITLLDSVHVRLATGGVPLPSLPPAEFVVNPAPGSEAAKFMACAVPDDTALRQTGVAMTLPGLTGALAADAEKLRGLGVDPVTAQPLPTMLQQGTQSVAFQSMDECRAALVADAEARRVDPMDAATVFGRVTPGPGEYDPLPGAPAQSATPLPLVPFTAGAAPSPTAPAAQPASGLAPLASPAPALLPVASAAAPAAPAPQASPAGGVELDADGLPWHPSIHAGTKRKNADGRWTAKKGINDPDLAPRVVAQLRAQMAAGGIVTPQPATSPAPHVTAVPVDALKTLAASPIQAPSAAPLPLPALATAGAGPSPTAPVAQLTSIPTSPESKPTPTTFADFMTAATVEVQSGRLTALQFGEACKPYGGPAGLASNPAAIPTVWAALKAQYPGML
jgi:hypothetical protein